MDKGELKKIVAEANKKLEELNFNIKGVTQSDINKKNRELKTQFGANAEAAKMAQLMKKKGVDPGKVKAMDRKLDQEEKNANQQQS
jgi:hypothetical protein